MQQSQQQSSNVSKKALTESYLVPEGSYDEWKSSLEIKEQWKSLTKYINDLGDEGIQELARKGNELLGDNGIVTEGSGGKQIKRQFTFDPIPVILSESDFLFIQKAVRQRAELLNSILNDCYGKRELLRKGLIHPSLLFNQGSYIRAMDGALPEGSEYLDFYAVDLGRTTEGKWVVLKDYTQVPMGLGSALESRVITTNLYREVVKDLRLIRLVHFFQSYRDTIYSHAPSGVDEPLVVMLSPKVKGATYFQDVYLSKYLGIPIVEGRELTVREDKVYLKSVSGLMRVHVIIRRIQEEDVDPLANPTESYNGVSGLIHVMRSGNVTVLNPPGTGILEVAELYPNLPQLCQYLRGEEMLMESFREHQVSCSSSPVWTGEKLKACPIKMRFFAYFDGKEYQVMEGGLAIYEIAGQPTALRAKDIWVLAKEDTEVTQHISFRSPMSRIKRSNGLLSSRSADNMFWIGRYSERSECVTRLILEIVLNVTEDGQRSGQASIELLLKTLEDGHFLAKGRFELNDVNDDTSLLFQILIDIFYQPADAPLKSDSVPYAITQLAQITSLTRARLSNGLYHIVRAVEKVLHAEPPGDFIDFRKSLYDAIIYFSAFNGTCLSNLTRTRGWHFIMIGKAVENAYWLVSLLRNALQHSVIPSSLLDSILSVNDTTLTYRFRYQSRPELGTVLDLILFDPVNQRSLYSQLKQINESLKVLETKNSAVGRPIDRTIRRAMNFLETEIISFDSEEELKASLSDVSDFLDWFSKELPSISEKLGWEFFTHVDYQPS